jgi:O-antigen ligase
MAAITGPRTNVNLPPGIVAAVALPVAFLVGAALARDVPLGLAFLLSLAYAPLVFINLPLGVILWLPLAFLNNLHALKFGPTLALMLIVFAWVGTLLGTRSATLIQLRELTKYIALVWAFLLWVLLSVAWSTEPTLHNDVAISLLISGVLFVLISTALVSRSHLKLAVGAFVVGAVLSVLVGLIDTGLQGPATAVETAVSQENRLGGGAGDPNYLAAGIVPAMVLCVGLMGATKRVAVRWGGIVSLGVLSFGFAAAQSRGGLVAAVVCAVAGFIVFKRRRLHLLVAVLMVLAVGAAWFSVNPQAWQRIIEFDSSGTGRTDLWDIAWRMGLDHPVLGVGLENFVVKSPAYAGTPQVGAIQHTIYSEGEPQVAHNAYIQMFAELGVIGVALWLAAMIASLRAGVDAGRRFERAGDNQMATLARSAVIAALGAMTASVFISNAHDRRTWILLALGPAFLALGRREERVRMAGTITGTEAPLGAALLPAGPPEPRPSP